MFRHRDTRPERIDTGNYTPQEYAAFLREIRFINRYLGDQRALKNSLLAEILKQDLKEFSILDVGAGTGELLGVIAEFARRGRRRAKLVGLDLNDLSIREVVSEAGKFGEISPVQGNALRLPFADDAFDYAFCSLFTHHLSDEQIPIVLREMDRVARRGIVVIDLERRTTAWFLYQIFCFAFRISPLVRQDGSLSIRKGFTCEELAKMGRGLGLVKLRVEKHAPFRVVMKTLC